MKDKSKLRTAEAVVRFTESEMDKIRWQSANFGCSMSQYIRFCTIKFMVEVQEAARQPSDFDK